MSLIIKLILLLSKYFRLLIINILLLHVLSFGLSENLFGQNRKLRFAVDHAQFRLQKNYGLLEIYYSINRNSLTFEKVADGYKSLAIIKINIKEIETTIFTDSLTIQDFVKSMDEISPSQRFAEISFVQILEGNYLLTSSLTDLKSNETVVYNDSLYLKSFSNHKLVLSDIELATSIDPQKEMVNKFDKNGLRVIPNANLTYGTGLTNLYFYTEAYNLFVEDEAQSSTYHLNYSILDRNGVSISEVLGRPKIKPGSSSVIHGSLDINHLTSGFYGLKIMITDDFTEQATESQKYFYVHKVEDILKRKSLDSEAKVLTSNDEFIDMNEQALDEYFQQVKYIADKDEIKFFKKLDVNGKRNFLLNFWKRRDPDPQTEINERKKEYLQLLENANQEFSIGSKPGWKSDRGRVLLIYGKPDQVDRMPASTDTKAYQTWYYYDIEGGVEFVFVDRMQVGDLYLVHSTMRNEIHDYDWKVHYALE